MRVSIRSSLPLELSAGQQLKTRKPWKMLGCRFFLIVATVFIIFGLSAKGRIMHKCEVARELQRAGISKKSINHWMCLIENESGLNTSLTNQGKILSQSHGIFQISSFYSRYCMRGRKGGLCNKKCEDFTDNDITDDIACAQKIFRADKFHAWAASVQACKDKSSHPNILNCFRQ